MIGRGGLARAREWTIGSPARRTAARGETAVPVQLGRYRIKQGVRGAVLTCVEAPTVRVRIQHGLCATATAARSAAAGSIFLDGAARGAPFLDSKREVYNLDHHEGCVRPFTLATCEQAVVLIRTGLDLRKRDWTVFANDADLDTVLAIWVLLNHIRLNDGRGATRARVMPLLRLQGVVDALGLEQQDLCGLPPEVLTETQTWIERLRTPELAAKGRGRWQDLDLLEHTADRLRAIDRLIYPPKQFDDLEEIDELVRVPIANGRVAIICRSEVGIYEVERQLRRLHGRRLAVIVLQQKTSVYTLRQVDAYLPATLASVYERLNLIDPAAGGHRSANRWGGSTEIGGSPRRSGTRVTPQQIASVCQRAYGRPRLLERLSRIGVAALGSAAIMLAALAPLLMPGAPGNLGPQPAVQFSMLLAAFGGALFLTRGFRAPGLYGLRRPARLDWLSVVPVAVLGALAGGVWIPAVHLPGPATALPAVPDLLALLTLPLAAEVIFRGLVQGSLVMSFAIQSCGGPWSVSAPTIVSAGLYALWGAVLGSPSFALAPALLPDATPSLPLLGAFVFGAGSAMARERSESIGASILLHWICVATVLLARAWISP